MAPKTITIIIILLLAGCTDPYQECYLRELPQAQKSLGLVQLQLKFEEDLAWSRRVQDFYDKTKVLLRLLEEAKPTLPKHNIEYPMTPELTENWKEELEAHGKKLDKYQASYEAWEKRVLTPILDDLHRQSGFKDSDHAKSETKELFGEEGEILFQFVMPRAKEAKCWGGDKEEISDDCKNPISAEKKYEREKGLKFSSDIELTSFITNRAILEMLEQAETKIEEVKTTSIRMAELTCANTMR